MYVSLAELRKLLNLLCRKSIALSTASFLESVLVVEIVGHFRRKSRTLTLTFTIFLQQSVYELCSLAQVLERKLFAMEFSVRK